MTLPPADRAVAERLLANELDMAFRRRTLVLLDYLELENGLDVLDAGCGMGVMLRAVERLRDVRLTGLDADPARLAIAARLTSAALVEGDVRALPFDDASFDRVVLSEVLEHVVDDGAVLRELRRVLRPGGVLALSVPHARYPFWWDPINRTWTWLGGRPIRKGPIVGIWTNHVRLYEPKPLAQLVRSQGFVVEAVDEATHNTIPFAHFLLYGVGKPLLERGLLPSALRSADRFAEPDPSPRRDPLRLARAVVNNVDRRNDRVRARRPRTFVNVLVKARKV